MTEPVSGSSLLQAQDVQRAASHNHVHHNTHTRHHHIRSHHQHKVLHQRQKEEAAEQQRQQQRQQEEESRELPRTQPQSQQPSPSPSLPAPSQSQVRNQTLPQSQPVTPPPPQQQQQQPEGGDSSIVHVVQTVNIVQLIDASGATVGVETFTSLPTTTSFVNSQPAPASSPLPEATPVSSSPPKVAALDSSLPEATQIAGPPKAAVAALPSDDAADVLSSILPTTAPSIDIPALVPMSPFPTVESFAKITSTPSSGSQPALSFSGSGVSNSTISSTTTQPPVASSSLFSTTNGTATDAITASSYRPSAGTNLTTSALPSSSGTVLFNGSFTTTLDPTESSLLPATSSPSGAAASGTGAITSTSTSASATLTPAATTFTSDGTTFTSDGTTFTFDGTTFSSDAITPSSAIATTTSPSPSPSSDGDLVGIFGGGAGGGASSTTGTPPAATTTGGSGGGSDSPSNPSLPGTVAGSVLGGIAGVAFILVLALVVLRWKKRQMSGKGQSPRGLLTGAGAGTAGFKTGATNTPEPGPGSGPGDHSSAGSPVSRTMTQRSSLPFIPASLANLKGSKRYSDRTATSSETGEKGFQKVSGRKLPSVLHYGGDGYTEPGNRDTVMSEASSYRDSIAMFTGPGMPRLALGSPMRPESGIVVFHDGPSRTPQQSTGAFSLNLEPPARDPLGRSHPSQDGSSRSHGSFSRFTEQI